MFLLPPLCREECIYLGHKTNKEANAIRYFHFYARQQELL